MSPDRLAGPTILRSITAILLAICSSCICTGCSSSEGDPGLYRTYCSACHGPEGQGLRALYPALEGSAYLGAKLDQLPCLIRKGTGGSIRMPEFPQLSNGEITDLIAYLDSRWGANQTLVSEQMVSAWLSTCP